MSDYARAINHLYGQADLSAKILTALRETGKDVDNLTRDDLMPFDEQHDGGQETTDCQKPTRSGLDDHEERRSFALPWAHQCPNEIGASRVPSLN